jgi:anthranilate synthase component I
MPDRRAEFLARSERGGVVVPLTREVVLDADTPLAAFAKVARPPFGFLLESLVGGERWARYTFLGTEPREVWRYRDRRVERWTRETGWRPAGETDDPIGHLAARMRELPGVDVPGLPRFTGGAVGYLGYDLVRTIERLPRPPADSLGLPDALLMIADTLVILDNLFGRATVVANVEVPRAASSGERLRLYDATEARLDDWVARLGAPHELAPLSISDGVDPLPTVSRYPRDAFERDVRRILEYIAAGDTFQTVLSRRQEAPGRVEPLRLYRYLRALNPAPYLFYLGCDDFAFVGSSPEVLVRVEGGEVTVRPIAGTRPRGRTPDEDEALARALLTDEKERAEHMMLVDLGRNDVGRVARYGTVKVTDLVTIERYSHVQHLVSEVRGRLKEGYDALDVFKACFPAGTVTGAPKVRAMEIIDELEPERRGPYAGAVGYVSWGAVNLDTAIAIRSAVVLPDRVVVQAGAGVVADSDPAREFAETEHKAEAVLRALALAKAPGFTVVQLLIVIVIFGFLSSLAWPSVSRIITHSHVNQAALVVAHDLAVASSAAARQRRPVRIALSADRQSLVVSDRATGAVLQERAVGRGTEYGLDSLALSVTPVDLFPSGFASSALTVTVTAQGYSRQVAMSRAGWVRVP